MANNEQKKPDEHKPISVPVRHYGEQKQANLPPGFKYDDDSSGYDTYATVLQAIPAPPAGTSLVMKLEDILGADNVAAIQQSGKIVFHAVGDTGADKRYRIVDEDDVAGMMAKDLETTDLSERPSFFFHLGDIVYEFGEAAGYYPQFYEPFCLYNAPIFAIPGNHDGMVYDTSMKSLEAYLNNFCTPVPVSPAPNAGGLSRSTMTQPGPYFTLDAPFVSIIGLYSNIIDKGPGVISSEGAKYPVVGDAQKNFLISELRRLKPLRDNNSIAVVLAVHHPPYTGTAESKSSGLLKDLDDAFTQAGLWPDAVISGHVHLYERFSRDVNGRSMPYVVAGCGGYNLLANTKSTTPDAASLASLSAADPTLQAYITEFGYLKIKAAPGKLAIIFNSISSAFGSAADSIVIDLATHGVTQGVKGKEPL